MSALKRWSPFVAALGIVGLASSARAQTFTGTLTSAQENNPADQSPGTGFAMVTLNGNLLTVNVNFSGLTSNTTASHIHCCQPFGTAAGVATTVPTFAGFPLGVTSGTYLNTLDLTQASSYNPAFVTANGGTTASAMTALVNGLLTGQSYLNIHTTQFGGGEIRAQLLATPEPSTYAMLATGLGLVGALGWRRRRTA